MVVSITPAQMANRLEEFRRIGSTNAMSAAAAKALVPVRRQARRKNFGFKDLTGQTRKSIGPIRRYKRSTVRRYGGGGAYFRGGGIVGALLEYSYDQKYQYLRPAFEKTRGAQFSAFTREANIQMIKEARRLRAGGR